MEQIFIRMLNMNLTGSIVIVAVLLARLLLRRAPKNFSYLLWGVVLFRLLCPFSVSSPLSLLGVLRAPASAGGELVYIPGEIGLMAQPAVTLPLLGDENPVSSFLPAATPMNSVNPMQLLLFFGAYLWLAGVLTLALLGLISGLRFSLNMRRLMREGAVGQPDAQPVRAESVTPCADPAHRTRRLPWRRTVIVYESPALTTAVVCGIFWPRIWRPAGLDAQEREYVLLHEKLHLRRYDPLFRLAGFLALCLHWFNPLVWIAYVLSGKDMEMSCDEAVIQKTGAGIKKKYTATLLSMAAGQKLFAGAPLAFAENDTGRRIRNVLRYHRPAKAVAITLVTLCLLLAMALITNPAAGANPAGRANPAAGMDPTAVSRPGTADSPQPKNRPLSETS